MKIREAPFFTAGATGAAAPEEGGGLVVAALSSPGLTFAVAGVTGGVPAVAGEVVGLVSGLACDACVINLLLPRPYVVFPRQNRHIEHHFSEHHQFPGSVMGKCPSAI